LLSNKAYVSAGQSFAVPSLFSVDISVGAKCTDFHKEDKFEETPIVSFQEEGTRALNSCCMPRSHGAENEIIELATELWFLTVAQRSCSISQKGKFQSSI
jgi:hypothetical protein